ncbi:hypothetical protein [Nocardiopsis listeri]|uniref:hypothetical protein n=1 Tax=Nocardiopsis listeri TaxID=53440 RepID=UPI000834F39C|nr:hypothetical protein [Nocardiopsis listeri]
MGVTTKLGLYAVGLVVVFAAAFGAGSITGPVLPEGDGSPSESVEQAPDDGRDHVDGDEEHQR